jgi:16S rRNA (guanine527-N7)-methyltransferase
MAAHRHRMADLWPNLTDFARSTWNASEEGPTVNGSDGLDEPQREQLRRFAELLRSSPHNLLSPRGLDELEPRHVPESIAFARLLPDVGEVLDVGSGGGLPGIVIAIVRPELTVHLLDATRKKADFLTDAVGRLGLRATVHHGRAEELATGSLRGAFEVVTARAVAPLERLVPWCAPFLRPGGRLYAIKGERWAEELETARGALRRARMSVHSTPVTGALGGAPATDPRVVVLERARTRGERAVLPSPEPSTLGLGEDTNNRAPSAH